MRKDTMSDVSFVENTKLLALINCLAIYLIVLGSLTIRFFSLISFSLYLKFKNFKQIK